jgi:hypothetical protein
MAVNFSRGRRRDDGREDSMLRAVRNGAVPAQAVRLQGMFGG